MGNQCYRSIVPNSPVDIQIDAITALQAAVKAVQAIRIVLGHTGNREFRGWIAIYSRKLEIVDGVSAILMDSEKLHSIVILRFSKTVTGAKFEIMGGCNSVPCELSSIPQQSPESILSMGVILISGEFEITNGSQIVPSGCVFP
jgi:hypothetical protein